MTPTAAIKALDRQLVQHGDDVVYHVMTAGAPDAGTTVRAFVRGLKPDDLLSGLKQGDRKVTLSPTSGVTPAEGHRLVIGGKTYRIDQPPEIIRMNSTVVRYNLIARG